MRGPGGPFPWWLGAVGAVFALLAAGLVVRSLDRPAPATYAPSAPGEVRPDSAAVRTVTLDARSPDRWVRFDLASGSLVSADHPGWDLAVRRFHVVVNGGDGLPGDAAVAATGDTAFSAVRTAPGGEWRVTRADADGELRHPLLEEWYAYDFFSHLLEARPAVWAVRSAEGRIYKLEFLSYYCPGPEAGCVTFRYAPLRAVPPGRRTADRESSRRPRPETAP